MILPIGHEKNTVARLPWVTAGIIALCVIGYFAFRPGAATRQEQVETFVAALRYYAERPFLEVDPRLVPPEATELFGAGEPDPKAAGRANPVASLQQQELDRLTEAWVEQTRRDPQWRESLIPSRPRAYNFVSYLFVHSGLLHLLGNLLFLYLTGPAIEDALGRPLFAAFYLLAGVASGGAFALHYPDLYRPLMGASGAIAALIGAFLVLYGASRVRFLVLFFGVPGTFSAPAWLMLPLWFGKELWSAAAADRLAPGGVLGGVAFWAHVWGFAFGLVAAAGLRGFWRLRGGGPIEVRARPVHDVELAAAIRAEASGDHEEAWRRFERAARDRPGDAVAAAAFWGLACKLRRAEEAAPVVLRTLRELLQRGGVDEALPLWRELRAALPDRPIDLAVATKLCEELAARERRDEGAELLAETVADLAPDTPPGLVQRILALARAGDPGLRRRAIERAKANPHLPPEIRDDLGDELSLL